MQSPMPDLSPEVRAKVLHEALPYIRRFRDKVVVIKYGGHAMTDPELARRFATDIVLLKFVGMDPVVVHGGGPQIGDVLKKMGVQSRFVDGERVTDAQTMDVVEMVLVGKINKEIVNMIGAAGGRAVGLSGKDGRMILARRVPPRNVPGGEVVDMGLVGEVTRVNPQLIATLDRDEFIPVIAPVGVDEDGNALNINADLVAGAVASALRAEKLILMTDVDGVMDRDGRLLHRFTPADAERMIGDGTIGGGMIPKVRCVLDALAQDVRRAHIINGKLPHAVLLELLTDAGIGTMIAADIEPRAPA